MKSTTIWLTAIAATAASNANPLVVDSDQIVKRGSPAAPDGYTPIGAACPAGQPSVRVASSLSPQESAWLNTRVPNTVTAMKALLPNLNITGFDATSYLNTHQNNFTALPRIGIAASGGGYRALMNGAGALSAMDSRTVNSTGSNKIGGLLQSSTYLAGLSGGGWLVGSLYQNNFTTVQSILAGELGAVWDFTNTIFEGPNDGIQILTSTEYYDTLHDQVEGKSDAGYNTTITDYWGRALSFQLINADDGGPSYTWSSLQNGSYITDGSAPLPVLLCDSRVPGATAVSTNTTIFEFNPWEMGSWDPTVFGFVPMEYVGSNFSAGVLADGEDCVRGFDSASYIMGTSSSLFNAFAQEYSGANLPSVVNNFILGLLNDLSQSEDDIASWVNPFYNYNPSTNPQGNSRQLSLVDGGENGENVPLHPLIQPVRAVDVIFAIDSSADTTYNWPNGTSLVATYERSLNASLENGTAFPAIPDQNTFVNLGLNTKPTFFGCDGTNTSNSDSTNIPPLIVYLPNSPYSYLSNVSTFNLSYEDSTRDNVINNGFNVVTRGNSTDDMWPTCLGCAILQRSLVRTGTPIPQVCTECFSNYCWNGTTNSTTPPQYDPSTSTSSITSGAVVGMKPELGMAALVAGVIAAVMLGL